MTFFQNWYFNLLWNFDKLGKTYFFGKCMCDNRHFLNDYRKVKPIGHLGVLNHMNFESKTLFQLAKTQTKNC